MHDYARGLNYALDTNFTQLITSEERLQFGDGDSMKCPLCRSNDTIPIFYGFPSHDSMENVLRAVDRGEIELGGCVVHDRRPSRHCKNCGHYFGSMQQSDLSQIQMFPMKRGDVFIS